MNKYDFIFDLPKYLNHVILGTGCPFTSQSKLTLPSRPTDASCGSFIHFGGAEKIEETN